MDKPKFNLIDGLIILLLVAVIAAGIYLIKGSSASKSNLIEAKNSVAEYQVQFTQSEMYLFDLFKNAQESGESVWVGEKERFEGKIVDVTAAAATTLGTDYKNGKAVLSEYTNLYDITVTLRSDVVETASSISAAGNRLLTGSEVAVKGKGFAGYGFIIDLKIVQ